MRHLRAGLRLLLLQLVVAVVFPLAAGTRLLTLPFGARGRRFALRAGVRYQALWARASLRIAGVELDTPASPPPGNWLVVANHTSYVDIWVLGALFPARFVAMAEIAAWPFLGTLCRSVSTIFVDRSKRRDVVRVGEEMRRSLEAGASVALFPEGSASSGAEVRPFHSSLLASAAALEIPCLPVALSYQTPGEPFAPAYTVGWWGNAPLWPHLWMLLGLRRIRARVRWAPEPRQGSDRKQLALDCRRDIERHFEPLIQEPPPPGDSRIERASKSQGLSAGSH